MDMIKFPVKFDRSGFQKHRDGSEDYYAQLLTISILTEPRTHVFSPRFGVLDPSFRGIDRGVFILNSARFVPEVQITNLNTNINTNGNEMKVEFSFRVKGEVG
jgi:hypothetical protein